MYGKIFESIYEGTLYGHWEAIVTLEQLVILAGKEGIVDMTVAAISGRTSIPVEVLQKGIEHLSKADPESRTDGNNGVRIRLINEHRNWGWEIVNHRKYRDLSSREDKLKADRERIKNKRAQKKPLKSDMSQSVAKCRKVSHDVANVANVAYTDTDTDTDINTSKEVFVKTASSSDPCPYKKIIDLYHEHLPMCRKVAKLTASRKSHILARWKDELSSLEQWGNYFDYVSQSDFLTGKKHDPGKRPFFVDIDFLIKPNNLVKIREKKYHV